MLELRLKELLPNKLTTPLLLRKRFMQKSSNLMLQKPLKNLKSIQIPSSQLNKESPKTRNPSKSMLRFPKLKKHYLMRSIRSKKLSKKDPLIRRMLPKKLKRPLQEFQPRLPRKKRRLLHSKRLSRKLRVKRKKLRQRKRLKRKRRQPKNLKRQIRNLNLMKKKTLSSLFRKKRKKILSSP